jgi:hypothetical protein
MAVTEQIKGAYTHVLGHLVKHGRAPHYSEISSHLGITPDEARELQRDTAEAGPVAGCWLATDTDHVESWAPFSNVPSNYWVSVDGVQRWYGQCGMESLAIRWLFPGQEVLIETLCLDCGEPIRVRMRDEELLEVSPEDAVGYMTSPFALWREGSSAFN